MRTFVAGLAVLASSIGSIAFAESHLVPTLEREFDVCQDRPSQPQFVTDLADDEPNKARLLQQVYRAEGMQRIVDANECSCETRFPTWDAAEAVYLERFSTADRNELREAISTFRRTANELRRIAKPICEQAGNW